MKIFRQHLVVVKSQGDEKYALLSQGTCVLQIFTDEGLIFASCECVTISMLICLKMELQAKERDLFDCFGIKTMNEFE